MFSKNTKFYDHVIYFTSILELDDNNLNVIR